MSSLKQNFKHKPKAVVFSLSISTLMSWSGGGAFVTLASTALTSSARFEATRPMWSPGLYCNSLALPCVFNSHLSVTRPEFSFCKLQRSFKRHDKILRECSLVNASHKSIFGTPDADTPPGVGSTGVKRTVWDDHECSCWSFDNDSMNSLSVSMQNASTANLKTKPNQREKQLK